MQVSTLSTTISALSHHLRGTTLESLADHTLVKLFMRSAFLQRPPGRTRYPSWKVSDLLDALSKMGPVASLSLKDLTTKTAALLAVMLAARCETLSKISLQREYFTVHTDKIVIHLSELPKGARPSNRDLKDVFQIYRHDAEPSLDPYSHVLEYIRRTDPIRKDCTRLFLSYVQPHAPVSSAAIGRWLKSYLSALPGGSQSSAHSIRKNSASVAEKHGASLRTIMMSAHWSDVSTYFRHYRVPDAHEAFQRAVLCQDA